MTTSSSFKKIAKIMAFSAVVSLLVISCKKKDKEEDPIEDPTTYTVPTTYNFSAIDTLVPRQAIAMLGELTAYIRKTHVNTNAFTLDLQTLRNYYANTGSPFSAASLNKSGFSLKEKTGNAYGLQGAFDVAFSDAVTASVNANADYDTTTAKDGYPGKLINGNRFILVDANGFEYKEFVEKNIMGSVFYYQATSKLNTIESFDNITVTNGLTEQERAWDQAFAYFGVPVNFPTNKAGLKNWGNYCNSIDIATGSNAIIMNAFIKGRAAISNRDNAGRDEARNIVVKEWEKVCAAKFISYVKGAKISITTPATFNHNLSEGVGFINSFRYNSAKTISDADINLLLSYFQTGGVINLYKVTSTNLDNAINKVAALFNIDPTKVP